MVGDSTGIGTILVIIHSWVDMMHRVLGNEL